MLLSPSGPFACSSDPLRPRSPPVQAQPPLPSIHHFHPHFHLHTFAHLMSVPAMTESTTCEALLDSPTSRSSPDQAEKNLGHGLTNYGQWANMALCLFLQSFVGTQPRPVFHCLCIICSCSPTIVQSSFPFPLKIFFFWLHPMACGIFVPQSGIVPTSLAVETQSLNCRTARDIPNLNLFKENICWPLLQATSYVQIHLCYFLPMTLGKSTFLIWDNGDNNL